MNGADGRGGERDEVGVAVDAAVASTRAPWLVFAALLALYAASASRTIQGGDTAEFVLVAARGGVAHPPGYPLHALLGRLFATLPLSSVPLRVALLSSVAGAAAAGLLARLLERLSVPPLTAAAAALAFGLGPVAWRMAGLPEVFSLGALLAALLLLASLRLAESARAGGAERSVLARAALVGLAAGLGASNHHTIALLAPVGVWALAVVARARGAGCAAQALAAALGGAVAGLLPYAELPLAAAAAGPTDWVWGDPRSARGLLAHVLRREYGTLSLGLSKATPRPLESLAAFWGGLVPALAGVYAFAALVGVAAAWRARRGLAGALLASLGLAGGLFLASFNLPRGPVADAVAERFHLLPSLLVAIFVGFGLGSLQRRAAGILRPSVLRPLLLAPLAVIALGSLERGVVLRGERTVERLLAATVTPLPQGAVVLGLGDLESFGFPYLAAVAGVRADVRYLDVHLLRLPWYHARARALVPEMTLPFDAARTRVVVLAESLVARGVPTYVLPALAERLRNVTLDPDGFLFRVRAPGAAAPALEVGVAHWRRAVAALGPTHRPPDEPWARHGLALAARPGLALAELVARAGRPAEAARLKGEALAVVGLMGAIAPPRLR